MKITQKGAGLLLLGLTGLSIAAHSNDISKQQAVKLSGLFSHMRQVSAKAIVDQKFADDHRNASNQKTVLSQKTAVNQKGVLKASVSVKLTNLLGVERKNELIGLDRSFLEKKLGGKIRINGLYAGYNNQFVTLQYDDLNQDGEWDKLVFLVSFQPKETVNLEIEPNNSDDVIIVTTAHVRQKRKLADDRFGPSLSTDSVPANQPNTDFSKAKLPPFLTEGPAWENDKIGFRIYMDVRNTKDIWGKTTSHMMMDEVGADPKLIYHHLAPWGMDILAVGKSLGAGSLAMSVPVTGKPDTLVRLGGQNMGKIIYRKIADGPVRAVFQMEYPEWNVLGNGKLTSLTEEISIWGGQYYYQSKVSVKNAPEGAALVTGIVNLKSSRSVELPESKLKVMYTFDQQSENKDNLGMAVLLSEKDLIAFGKTPNSNSEVLNTYTVKMKLPSAGKGVTFRYYSCWELTNPVFATEAGFKSFLEKEAVVYNSPVKIK